MIVALVGLACHASQALSGGDHCDEIHIEDASDYTESILVKEFVDFSPDADLMDRELHSASPRHRTESWIIRQSE